VEGSWETGTIKSYSRIKASPLSHRSTTFTPGLHSATTVCKASAHPEKIPQPIQRVAHIISSFFPNLPTELPGLVIPLQRHKSKRYERTASKRIQMFISIGKETELWNWACDDITKNTEREHPFFPIGTFAVHFWKNMTRWDCFQARSETHMGSFSQFLKL